MRENNYPELVNQLENSGFGKDISLQLLNQIYRDQPQFTTQHVDYFGTDRVNALLQFRKSDETGMYFFDNFKLQVLKGNALEAVKQTFYNSSVEGNITLKEAYNLLEGRAVFKEINHNNGEKNNTWIQLDFKQTDEQGNFKKKLFSQDYGYNLEAVLSKYPILETNDVKSKAKLIESLEKGNRQPVTYRVGNLERKIFIEAVPRFKSVNFYDVNLQRLKSDQLAVKPAQTMVNDNKQVSGKQQKEPDGMENGIKSRNGRHSKRAGIS